MNMLNRLCVGAALFGMALLGGCFAKRFEAKPVESNGVRVVMLKGSATVSAADIVLRVHNNTSQPLVVDGNKIAIIDPKGRVHYANVVRPPVLIASGTHGMVRVTIRDFLARFKRMRGVFVRLDGVFLNGAQMHIDPLIVGRPVGEPPPSPVLEPSNKVLALFSKGSKAPSAAKAPLASGGQAFQGMRKKIAIPVKCAVLPVRSKKIGEAVVFVVNELLLTEVQRAGFEAMGPEDISAILGFEKMKDDLGCDEASCMAEIGNALGVKYVLRGSIAPLGEGTMFSINLLNVVDASVIARVSRIGKGGVEETPRLVAEAVQELVTTSDL